jgi:hypothetical protein
MKKKESFSELFSCYRSGVGRLCFVLVLTYLAFWNFQVYGPLPFTMGSDIILWTPTLRTASQRHVGNVSRVGGIVPRAEIRSHRTKDVRVPKLGSFFVSTRDSSASSGMLWLRGALATSNRAGGDNSVAGKQRSKVLESSPEALAFTDYANWVVPGANPCEIHSSGKAYSENSHL